MLAQTLGTCARRMGPPSHLAPSSSSIYTSCLPTLEHPLPLQPSSIRPLSARMLLLHSAACVPHKVRYSCDHSPGNQVDTKGEARCALTTSHGACAMQWDENHT